MRTARRRVLHIDPAWPWADVIITAHRPALRPARPLTTAPAPTNRGPGGPADNPEPGLRSPAQATHEQDHDPAKITMTYERSRLERRTADFGNPDIYRGPTASPIWCVAQSIAATWASRPEVATEWARTLQSNQLNPWADQAALWLTARTENDDVFAERVEPLSRDGIPALRIEPGSCGGG